jgi:hypothetical protein
LFQEYGESIKEPKMVGHGQIGIGKKVVFKLFLSNHHCNVCVHFEIFDAEAGEI